MTPHFRKDFILIALFLFGLCLFAASPLYAAVSFNLVGVENPAHKATVTMRYDDTQTPLVLNITNTSSDPDARFTGFALNVPDGITEVISFSGPLGWSYAFNPDKIKLPGSFGLFDMASVTGTDFNAGFPKNGVPPGETFHVVFTLKYEELDPLTEQNFVRQYSVNYDRQQKPAVFIGYFARGDGQEVDPAVVSGEINTISDFEVIMPSTRLSKGEFFDVQDLERQKPAPPVQPTKSGAHSAAEKEQPKKPVESGEQTETPPTPETPKEQGMPILLIIAAGIILFLIIWGLFKLLLG